MTAGQGGPGWQPEQGGAPQVEAAVKGGLVDAVGAGLTGVDRALEDRAALDMPLRTEVHG